MEPYDATRRQIDDMPPFSIRASSIPKSIDEESRTVDVVFSTGAAVTRTDWGTGKQWVERLAITPDAVRLDRLNAGAPVLDTHSSLSINDQIGVVVGGSAKIVGKEARATLQFSKRETVDPIWQDVRDGVLRNVSVGYRVYKFEETAGTGGNLPVRTAIDWEPFEISMVPMPADPRAQVRDGGMYETNVCMIVRGAPSEYTDEVRRADEDRIRRLRLAIARAYTP